MNSKEISTLISQGRAYNSSSFLLRVMKSSDVVRYFGEKTTQNKKTRAVSYIVSKKIFKTAITRNKAKRRLRNAFMQACSVIGDNFKGWNMAFSAKKDVNSVEFSDLLNEMKATLVKVV